jgi:hypothetical protein
MKFIPKLTSWLDRSSDSSAPALAGPDPARAPALVQDARLERRKLTFRADTMAPRRMRKLVDSLTGLHAQVRYEFLGPGGPYAPDPSARSQAVLRQAIDSDGHVRTLRAAPSFTSFTTSLQPLGPLQKEIPDSLKTSLESVLRDVVYVRERRFRGTDGGLLEVRDGPDDLQWKPCDGSAGEPRPYSRPTLHANGRAYAVRNRREVVDLSAAANPQHSIGAAVLRSPSPIVSLAVGAGLQGIAMVNETRPDRAGFALIAAALSPGSAAPARHAVVLGAGEPPAPTPQRPYSTLAIVGDRLLLAGEHGGMYALPLSAVQANDGRDLNATPDASLAAHGRLLGLAHVHDGKGGTALHALCLRENGRLSSACWNPTVQRFEPGEDFGADALLYAASGSSRRIELPASRTISLDGLGTEAGIIERPPRHAPGLKPKQLLFREAGGDWKPFTSKYGFHDLSVDPSNAGLAYALVQEGSSPKQVAALSPHGDPHIPLGVARLTRLADASGIRVQELPTTHAPERFAAGPHGVIYYTDRLHRLHVHRGSHGPSRMLSVQAPPDEPIPLPPGIGNVQALAVDSRHRLHVLADGQLLRRETDSTWKQLDLGLPRRQPIVDLTHNRLGDVQVHTLVRDRKHGGTQTLRLEDRAGGKSVKVVSLRARSPVPSLAESEASDTAIGLMVKQLVKVPSNIVAAATAKLSTMRSETFPAVKKLWDTYVHRGRGHEGLAEVYEGSTMAFEELRRLAASSTGQRQEQTLAQFLHGTDGDLRREMRAFADTLADDLEHTLEQLGKQAAAKPDAGKAVAPADDHDLLADLQTVLVEHIGADAGEPGRRAAARLRELRDAGLQLRYTGLDEAQARQMDNDGGLVAARAATLLDTMVALAGLRHVAAGERLNELRGLMRDHENYPVMRATNQGFTRLRDLENAYSARAQVTQDMADPTSPLFGHVADMLDESRAALGGPTAEPTLRERIAQLSSGGDDPALRQELVDAMRHGFTRLLLNSLPGDETTLNVERGIGFDALGVLMRGGAVSADAIATTNFDYAVAFSTGHDGLSLELRRTKSYEGSLGVGVSATPAVVAQVGGEARGSGRKEASAGARISFSRDKIAAVVSDLLDPDKSLLDVMSNGARSEQVASASHTFGGTLETGAKLGKMVDCIMGSTEADAFMRPVKASAEVARKYQWGSSTTNSRMASGAATSGSTSTKGKAVEATVSAGGATVSQTVGATVTEESPSHFVSAGGDFKPLPTVSKSLAAGESTAGVRIEGWGVPPMPQATPVIAMLDDARRIFPAHTLTLEHMQLRLAQAGGITGTIDPDLLGDMCRQIQSWACTSVAGKQEFLDQMEALALRGRMAVEGRETFASARLALEGSGLDEIEKQAPQVIEALREAALGSLELSTYLERALALPGAKLHVDAELKPGVDRQAQLLMMEADGAHLAQRRDEATALCNDPSNHRITQLTITSSADYASHANFAPVIITIGGGSGAAAQTVRGTIRFVHDAAGIVGFSASRGLRQAHDTREDVDRRMRQVLGQLSVHELGTVRYAVTGQTRDDRMSVSSWASSIGLGMTFSTSYTGSSDPSRRRDSPSRKTPSPPRATPSPKRQQPSPERFTAHDAGATHLIGAGTRFTASFAFGSDHAASPSPSRSGYDPYSDPESLYYWLRKDAAATANEPAPEPVPEPVPVLAGPPAFSRRRTLGGMVHKVNKSVRKAVGARPPSSRKDRTTGG